MFEMKHNAMQQDFDDYDLDEAYDLSQMPVMPKGRYAPERRIAQWALAAEKTLNDDESLQQEFALWDAASDEDWLKFEAFLTEADSYTLL